MDITFIRWTPDDTDALAGFLAGNTFPFHMTARWDEPAARERIADGAYDGEDTRTYWIDATGESDPTEADAGGGRHRLGIVMLEELGDLNPVFDLRLAESYRGRGLGVPVLRALTAFAFEQFPEIRRFEGQTRDDNIAMRRTFQRCGFVKEAHYREGWPLADGTFRASVAYAILRADAASGTTTPVPWNDLPE